MPSIAVERVLLVHDEPAGVEHLIREIAFASVDRPFGFVVPTPTRPSVFKADDRPWGFFERKFPMEDPTDGGAAGFGSGAGRLGGAGSARVLEIKRIGSFASYVLQADDGKAMKGWLDRNRFETTKASEAWLEHHARLRFYFVALRFEPGFFREKVRHLGHASRAETLRITFETPVPFYPYNEPDRDDLAPDRALALWLISNGPTRVPVSLVQGPDGPSYRRPWREGARRPPVSADTLAEAFGDAWKGLVKPGDSTWRVQVFEDQKRERRGFGDVLLVPEERADLDAGALEKVRPLLPLLDPALEAP